MEMTPPAPRRRIVEARLLFLVTGCAFLMAACGNQPAVSSSFEERLATFAERAHAHPERIALLVGISEYSASGLPDLPGSRNDVALVGDLLVERFGYSRDDLLVLLDAEVTHANLVRAFDQALLGPAREGSEIFVFLAGHGSRILDNADTAYAEPDASDSTFVTVDSRRSGQQGQHDFSDDELRSLLTALTGKTDRVIVVTDSCHSGGLVRGARRALVPEAKVALDLAWVRSFWPEGVALSEDGPGRRLDENSFVHIAASRRDQTAQELTVTIDGEERAHGALTYFLVKTLEDSPRDASWSDVIDTLSARTRREAHQSITAQGDLDRLVFSSGTGLVSGYRARATINAEQIEVEAGFLLGLREGSILEVCDVRGTESLGSATIERVFPDRSVARWQTSPAAPAPLAYRVRESHRGAAEPPLRILDSGADAFFGSPLAILVPPDERPTYRVIATEEGPLLETLDGIPIGPAEDATLQEELTFRSLRDLAEEQGRFPLRLDLRSPSAVELEELGSSFTAVEILSRDAHSCAVVGTPFDAQLKSVAVFDLTNESSERLFVYLLSLEDSRQRNLITIPGQEEYVVLEAGGMVSIPAVIVTRESWGPSRPMLDRYLALAFPNQKLRNPRALESRKSVNRGEADALPNLIEHLLHGQFTRGSKPVPLSPEGWGVTHLDLLVVDPAN